MMAPDDELSDLMVAGGSEARIRELACKKGMRTLRMDAAEKVLEGTTSIAEVFENTDGPAVENR